MAHSMDFGATDKPKTSSAFQNLVKAAQGNAAEKQNLEIPTEDPKEAATPEPAEKAPAAQAGKIRKNKSKPNTHLRAKERDKDATHRITFHITDEEYEQLFSARIKLRCPVSVMAHDGCMDYIRNTYTCASCGAAFTLRSSDNAEEIKPAYCPCCGKNIFYRLGD